MKKKTIRKLKTNETSGKLLDSVKFLGECKCGGQLVISTLAPKEERFVVSCLDCGSVSDVRFPKHGDEYLLRDTEDNPLKLLCRKYEEIGVVITDGEIESTPISPRVNKIHGDL